jgi:hypothetical protein
MRFVRTARQQGSYDPNSRHVIYGQDADLLLLALLCHEPRLLVWRENMRPGVRASQRLPARLRMQAGAAHALGWVCWGTPAGRCSPCCGQGCWLQCAGPAGCLQGGDVRKQAQAIREELGIRREGAGQLLGSYLLGGGGT